MRGVITGEIIHRVLITGSREWTDVSTLTQEVEKAALAFSGNLVFVHGDCPTGADNLVEKYCRTMGNYGTERYPADWSKGKIAGPEHNRKMVNLGADLCLAFCMYCTRPACMTARRHISHGTNNCMTLASRAGIPVRQIWPGNTQQERLF